MGREVRRVAPDWQHPKDDRGRYIPKHEGAYQDAAKAWHKGYAAFRPDEFSRHYWEDSSTPEEDGYMYDEPPDPDTLTHFQMYENTSEGTPISPVFADIETLAHWLADNNASAFGGMTASYEEWLSTCQRGWAVSAVMVNSGIIPGVSARLEDK